MIDTIIFDLDGTLLNTLEDITESVNHALRALSCPERKLGEVRMMVGNSVDHLIHCALPQGHDEQLFLSCRDLYEEHYHKNMRNKTAPYQGIDEMLAQVSSAGYKLAVVSNKSEGFTKELIAELFGKYIHTAVGQCASRARKPSPDGVFYALELLGSKQEDAVYIGDSEVDALTARNSGLPCVGVLWGFRDRETLEREHVARIIEKPSELLAAIRSL